MEHQSEHEDYTAEWLASTGFLLPENDTEYKRFKSLFPNSSNLAGGGINVAAILEGKEYNKHRQSRIIALEAPMKEYKLVATTTPTSPKNSSDSKKGNQKNKG